MALSLHIPSELQIGAVDVTTARRGTVIRRLQQAIQRLVFDGQDNAGDDNESGDRNDGQEGARKDKEDEKEKRLGDVLAQFEARLQKVHFPDKEAQAYWVALNALKDGGEEDGTAEPSSLGGDMSTLSDDDVLIEPVSEPVSLTDTPLAVEGAGTGAASAVPTAPEKPPVLGPKAALFCLTFHGLCGAIALERLGAEDEDLDEDSPFVEGLKEFRERMPASERGKRGGQRWHKNKGKDSPDEDDFLYLDKRREAHFATARRVVADLLRRRSWQVLKDVADEPGKRQEIVEIVAATLIVVLVACLDDWFEIGQEVKGAPRRILVKSGRLVARLDHLVAEMPFAFTPQPLRAPVRYELTGTSNEDNGEGFQVDLISYQRRNAFITDFHNSAMTDANRSPQFATYVEAANAQMAVAWRINRPLYEVVRILTTIVTPEQNREPDWAKQVSATGLSTEQTAALEAWTKDKLYRPEGKRRPGLYEKSGEFLDHMQAQQVLRELAVVVDDPTRSEFYLCWKADFRGRIYAHTPWLTPQGGDVQRALFEFAQGRPLDENGVRALRRHGANLVSASRVLGDLKIKGRKVVTLEERERWVQKNEARILASARDPLREDFWRDEKIKKPIQFLSFCLAYAQWESDPQSPIHLPVQIDGTCNGLQHIAALTGDESLARAVNVLPRADGVPSDIYSDLAEDAALRVSAESIEKGTKQAGIRFANRWLERQPGAFASFLDRDTAKAVVMTIPYGATHTTQSIRVLDSIEDKLLADWKRDPDPEGLAELVAFLKETEGQEDFVRKCTHGVFRKEREAAEAVFSKGGKSALDDLWRLEVLGAFISWTLVARLREALSSRFPLVDAFSEWLHGKASAASGLPLAWLTPLGFPVCQNKFEPGKGSITAKLGEKSERLDVRHLGMAVSRSGQRNGLMPNLIHSLDSTHLAMVLVRAKAEGIYDIGSIHDCLQCHPNEADALSRIVREEFARLYAPDVSGNPTPRSSWEVMIDIVALSRLPNQAKNLLAVLDDPGGLKAEMMRANATADKEAKLALDLLSYLQDLDEPQRHIARQVLLYAGEHYVDPQSGSSSKPPSAKAKRKRKTPEVGLGKTESSSANDAAGETSVGGDDKASYGVGKSALECRMRGALPLEDGLAMSPYFFS